MYGIGNCKVGVGMRISAAANVDPVGGLGGVMVTFASIGEVPFGAVGTCWTVRVLSSSCNVYNSLSVCSMYGQKARCV